MVKVICAILRFSDDEKSSILDHEKQRQHVSERLFNKNIFYKFIFI